MVLDTCLPLPPINFYLENSTRFKKRLTSKNSAKEELEESESWLWDQFWEIDENEKIDDDNKKARDANVEEN